jgi:hypothetical protein
MLKFWESNVAQLKPEYKLKSQKGRLCPIRLEELKINVKALHFYNDMLTQNKLEGKAKGCWLKNFPSLNKAVSELCLIQKIFLTLMLVSTMGRRPLPAVRDPIRDGRWSTYDGCKCTQENGGDYAQRQVTLYSYHFQQISPSWVIFLQLARRGALPARCSMYMSFLCSWRCLEHREMYIRVQWFWLFSHFEV